MDDVHCNDSLRARDGLVAELDWRLIKDFISSRSRLKKKFTTGGFKLLMKNRSHAENIIKKECTESELSDLFLGWYRTQEDYAGLLDPYFETDQYEEWSKDRGLSACTYALCSNKFDEFIAVLKPEHVFWFLYISPIVFDKDQNVKLHIKVTSGVEKIVQHSGKTRGSAENVDYVLEDKIKSLESEKKFLQKQNKKLMVELEKDKAIIEKLKDKNLNLKKEIAKDSKYKDEYELNFQIEEERFENVKKQFDEELKVKETSFLKLLGVSKEKDRRITNLYKKLKNLQDSETEPFYKIISLLDYEKFISNINAPDDVQELLSTVVRPSSSNDTDADQGGIENLEVFWRQMMKKEVRILEGIFNLNAKDVAERDFFENWDEQVDNFVDLKCSLSARLFLVDMVYEILRQFYIKNILK